MLEAFRSYKRAGIAGRTCEYISSARLAPSDTSSVTAAFVSLTKRMATCGSKRSSVGLCIALTQVDERLVSKKREATECAWSGILAPPVAAGLHGWPSDAAESMQLLQPAELAWLRRCVPLDKLAATSRRCATAAAALVTQQWTHGSVTPAAEPRPAPDTRTD